MDINQVTSELDELFAQEKINEIPQFLESHIAQALEEGAQDIVLNLYNETIGFYRETGQYELSVENCQKALALMDEMGIQNSIPYATTLLNIANAYRAAGRLQDSLAFYNQVRPVYEALLNEDDMYFASFYNNLSLLYQEMGDFAAAKEQLVNALCIVNHKEDKQFEVAVTQANLANTCIELEQDEEAKARAEEAIRIFEEIGVDDSHYSAALSALGSLYYMDKDYENALGVMEKARDCVAKYLGSENIQYERLSENIKIIKRKIREAADAKEEAEALRNLEYTEDSFEDSAAGTGEETADGTSANDMPAAEAVEKTAYLEESVTADAAGEAAEELTPSENPEIREESAAEMPDSEESVPEIREESA
ncbi:MAG: tetratricopeptide repeat protein, partial [Lachnospiraceae bacterium]